MSQNEQRNSQLRGIPICKQNGGENLRKKIGCLLLAVLLVFAITIHALAEENYTIEFSLGSGTYEIDDYIRGTGKVLKGEATVKSVPVTVVVEDSSGNSVFEAEQYNTKQDGEFEVDFKMPYGTLDGTYTMSLKAFTTEKVVDFSINSQTEEYSIDFTLNKSQYKVDEYIQGTGQILLGETTVGKVPVTLVIEDETGKSVLLTEQYTTDINGNFEINLKMPYGTTEGLYVMKLKAFEKEKELTFEIEEDSSSVVLESISISTGSVEIWEGETLQLELIGKMSDGTDASNSDLSEAIWSSSDESIAEIDDTGLVTAVSEGTVTIKVEVGELTDEIEITVEEKEEIELEEIEIEEDATEIEEGETLQLELTGKMSDGTEASDDDLSGAIWSSSDESIAEVDYTGLVTAVSEGTVTIKVEVGELTDEIEITVEKKEEEIELEEIEIEADTTEIEEGETLQLILTGKMSDGTEASDDDLSGANWSSSDESIAVVDDTGLVTAVAEGTVIITVEVGELTDEIELEIQEKETTNNGHSSSGDSNNPKEETKQGSKITTKDRYGNKVVKFEIDTNKMKEQIEDEDSKTISIDAIAQSDTDTISVNMDSELVSEARKKGKKLEVNIGNVVIEIEADAIEVEEGASIEFKIDKLKEDKAKEIISKKESSEFNSISEVYNFELNVTEGEKTQKLQFNKSITIAVKYNADEASNPEKIGIYYYNEETEKWEYVGGRANGDGTIVFTTEHFSKYAVMEYDKQFADVDIAWANNEIEVLASRHIIIGVDDNNFAPNNNITRAEFAKLIVKALELEGKDNIVAFTDVEANQWYTEPVEIISSLGIVTGYDGRFNPDDPITREEMATMVVRAMKHVDSEGEYTVSDIDFTDKDEISAWAKATVTIAEEKGLINGTEENKFAPKKTTTRAEAAVVIYRLLKLLDRI